MSLGTKIEWSEATWNTITGCTKVSPGCDHCYIERTPPFRTAGRTFDKPGVGGTTGVQLHPDRLTLPLRWRKPRRIFVNSLADLFHRDIPDEFIARVFAVMGLAGRHTFQLLTKRHARLRSLLHRPDFREAIAEHGTDLIGAKPWRRGQLQVDGWTPTRCEPRRVGAFTIADTLWSPPWPLPNVWVGVSVESQLWADVRIPLLLDTPAAVRWLSCEPLLGPVDLTYCIVAEWAKDAAAVVDAAKAVDHAWRFVNGTGARMAVPLANLSAAVDALEATELVGDGIGTALPPAVEGCICSHTVHMDVPGAPVELNADADCPVHGEKAYHG